jgi:hypothetical protein
MHVAITLSDHIVQGARRLLHCKGQQPAGSGGDFADGAEAPQIFDVFAAWPTLGSGSPHAPLQFRQIHLRSVAPSLDLFRDHLPADNLATLLIECQGRLTIELPTVVERLGHSMTKRCIILTGKISISFHPANLPKRGCARSASGHASATPRALTNSLLTLIQSSHRPAQAARVARRGGLLSGL